MKRDAIIVTPCTRRQPYGTDPDDLHKRRDLGAHTLAVRRGEGAPTRGEGDARILRHLFTTSGSPSVGDDRRTARVSLQRSELGKSSRGGRRMNSRQMSEPCAALAFYALANGMGSTALEPALASGPAMQPTAQGAFVHADDAAHR